jgi:carbon starvation protein CstA
MGRIGSVLAVLGVVFAPITTGDTAFRMGRIMIAELFHFDQKPIKNRLAISIPMFGIAILILIWSVTDKNGFDTIWRYFAWGNQFLAMVTLWASTIYLVMEKKFYWITFVPAMFMTMVTTTFLFIAEHEGFGLSPAISYTIGICITILCTTMFLNWKHKYNKGRI